MILAGAHAGERELLRFRTEAEAIAQLQHPNIVQIYEIGEHDGRPYFSLEYVEGGSLDRKLAGTPQPPREAAGLAETLARAMEAAHQHGVVHRDLKPANVLLANGVPKISDFGLAKRLDDESGQTQSGTILGSPSYMAPEQAEGKARQVGPLADVYSLGAILYELLTGRPPFKGTTLLDTLQQVREQEPVPPRALNPRLPRDLETICLKCLRKDARLRYPSAEGLADDLRRFLDGRPILARPLSAPRRLYRWCRRNPLGVAVVALLVLLTAGSWALLWRISQEKERTETALRLAADNAAKAQQNARQAQTEKVRAETNAERAFRKHDLAMREITGLAKMVQQKVRDRTLAGTASADVRSLGAAVIETLRVSIDRQAKALDGEGMTSFGSARTYQVMGDFYRDLGQGKEALDNYCKAHEAVKQVLARKPKDDVARGNYAFTLALLAGKTLDLNGDARAAHKTLLEACDVQEDVAAHPQTNFYKPIDNNRLRANYARDLGKIKLALGDPAAARKYFEETLAFRKKVVAAARPGTAHVEATGYAIEARYYLGQACARVGDKKAAETALGEALAGTVELVKRFPNYFDFKHDLGDVYGARGDARVCLGQLEEARADYEQALPLIRYAVSRDPQSLRYLSSLALAHYRLGQMALAGRDPDAAAAHFGEALALRRRLAQIDPTNIFYQGDLAASLAQGGLSDEAVRRADALRQRIGCHPRLFLQLAGCYARCAGGRTGTARQELMGKALSAVRAATAEGYKDALTLRTDLELVLLRDEPAYRELLAKVAGP
jgi:serine/threonine-protein kinase